MQDENRRNGYPIAIVQDRYTGVYSKGRWVAIAAADDPNKGGDLVCGLGNHKLVSPWGNDVECMEFWDDPPDFVAVGDTPDSALSALKAKGWDIE